MLLAITLVVRSVTATIYVKADVAPYLYSWCSQDGKTVELLNSWPGTLMTETEVVKGESFWKMFITTPENVTSFNIIFNDGSYYQTEDIIGLSSDRYYTYDGIRGYSDVSEDYETVPNAEISQVELSGFNYSGYSSLMTKEEDYIYTMSIDLSTINNDCSFKLLVNGSIYGDLMSNLVIDAPEGWVEKQGDNCILHHSTTDYKSYLFTATWEPNVNALEGWTLKVEGLDCLYDLVDATDWDLLQAIYKSMGSGSGWIKTWDFSHKDYTNKYLSGVTTREGHVVGIDLSKNGLTGQFPVAFTSLPYLESLNISGNTLSGDIGMTMAAYAKTHTDIATKLTSLDISDNQFTGNIGLFAASLPNLQSLDASHNCIEDVYPMISTGVTSLNIGKQSINRIVDMDFSNFTVESMAEKLPSILLYNHAQQSFSSEINILCTTGELPDYRNNWSVILSYKNGKATVPYASAANVYYGQSGDVLNAGVVNDNGSLEGSTFRIKLNFNNGDVNFDGQVNVLDVQTDVMYIIDNYKKRPFNFTAANLWPDEQINVQDIVPLVNLLFETETAAAPMVRRSANTSEAEATVFCRSGSLVVNTMRPVAAFDITLSDCNDINLKTLSQQGFVCESRQTRNGLRLIGYSLSGNTLPVGETIVGKMNTPDATVNSVQLADSDALEIVSAVGDGNSTGINTISTDMPGNNEIYRIPLGNGHAISINSQGRKTLINNTKTIK